MVLEFGLTIRPQWWLITLYGSRSGGPALSSPIPVAVAQSCAPQPAFNPFYWRIVQRTRHPVTARVCIAIILGLIFLAPHLLTSGAAVFNDLSWMIGVLISSAMLFLYYATSTLINLISEVDTRVSGDHRNLYMEPLRFWLSDGKFVLTGVFFGVMNCIVGYSFGVRYESFPSKLTIFFGFFVVGFVCGMAAFGLSGVFDFVRGFIATKPTLDYREPDKCAGTSFLGEALVKFSLVNLVMGVLISIYIVFAPWANRNHILVRVLMWAWIGFPFFVSLAHLFGTWHGRSFPIAAV